MAYNPLQTLQGIRMQQAQRDAAYLDQQSQLEASRLEREAQLEDERALQTFERTMRTLEREDQRKQQDFENGIRLMEKEAELSEMLGRDVRGDLGELTGRRGESAVTGDMAERRENIATAGVQARKLAEQEKLKAAEVAFNQKREERLAREDALRERMALFGGTPEQRAVEREQKGARREALIESAEQRAEVAPRKEARAEERHGAMMEGRRLDALLKTERLKKARQRLPKGTSRKGKATKSTQKFLRDLNSAVYEEISGRALGATAQRQSELLQAGNPLEAKKFSQEHNVARNDLKELKGIARRVFSTSKSMDEALAALKAELLPLHQQGHPFAREYFKTLAQALEAQVEE